MNSARWVGFVLLAALGLLFAIDAYWTVEVHAPVASGAVAPVFRLPQWSGGDVGLQSGRVTLIDFWASWCGPCRAELPTLSRLAERYHGQADFIAVNVEEHSHRAEVQQYLAAAQLKLSVALDGNEVAERYRVDSLPHLVVVGRDGRVRDVLIGPRGEGELVGVIEAALR